MDRRQFSDLEYRSAGCQINDFDSADATDRKLLSPKQVRAVRPTVPEQDARRHHIQIIFGLALDQPDPANPFKDEASAVGSNPARMMMVPSEWIEHLIRETTCEDWKIILAFCRYAGMRSHEARIQRWDDVDLVKGRMLIRSNKSPAVRTCPIFPELRAHLMRAKEMAPSTATMIQTRYTPEANPCTTLRKMIVKAGLKPWPKLFQNLRATRETELLAKYPGFSPSIPPRT